MAVSPPTPSRPPRGRVAAERRIGGNVAGNLVETTYSYDYPAIGGTIVTTGHPDGAESIRRTYRDGTFLRSNGAADFGRERTVSADSATGEIIETVYSLGAEGLLDEWVAEARLMGRIQRLEYPDGATETRSYDGQGRLAASADADGVVTFTTYDAMGRVELSGIDMPGPGGTRNGTPDPAGSDQLTLTERETFLHNGAPARRETTSVYATDGSAATTTVRISEAAFDQTWRRTVDVAGGVTLWEKSPGASGHWKDRTETTTLPDGTQTVETYSDDLLVSRVHLSAPDGSGDRSTVWSVSHGYATDRRTTTTTDSRTGATGYSYFPDGSIETVTEPDPDGGGPLAALETSYVYDDMGRVTQLTLPDDSVVHTEYTPRGEVAKTWGSQQYPVEYTYDEQGRQLTMTTWQDFDETTGQGLAGAAVTSWIYDSERGWLERKEYDDGNGTDYTYTDAGRLETRTWERGVVTTYAYDDAGQQVAVDYSDSTADISYTYNRTGQPETVSDATGTRSFGYDADLRLDTEEFDATYFDNRILTRLYEDGSSGTVAGRPAGFELGITTDPDQDVGVGYSYDSAGRLSTVSDGADTFEYSYIADSANLLAQMEGPVHTARYTYEPGRNARTVVENEETVGTASTVSKYTYRYNELGQRTDRVDEGSAFAQPALYIWSYDDRGQVTAADRYLGTDPDNPGSAVTAEDATFDYDKIGNRLTSTFGTATQRDYTANALNQYTYLTNPAASPTHDADGNMTHDGGGWYFEWNGENRMVEARNYADIMNPSSGAVRLTFTYDYQGRRVEKTVEEYDGPLASMQTASEQRFIYDGWNLIATFEVQPSSLSLQTSYLWGHDLSGSMQGAGGVGGLLSVTKNQEPGTPNFYPTYDANGNVSEYLDENGAIAAHYEYSPFGRIIASTGSPDDFAFRFSTKYTDDETDLVYYGFRYYHPGTGRWLNQDPIQEAGGLNLYAFVGNDGVNSWDLFGLAPPSDDKDKYPEVDEAFRESSREFCCENSDPPEGEFTIIYRRCSKGKKIADKKVKMTHVYQTCLDCEFDGSDFYVDRCVNGGSSTETLTGFPLADAPDWDTYYDIVIDLTPGDEIYYSAHGPGEKWLCVITGFE